MNQKFNLFVLIIPFLHGCLCHYFHSHTIPFQVAITFSHSIPIQNQYSFYYFHSHSIPFQNRYSFRYFHRHSIPFLNGYLCHYFQSFHSLSEQVLSIFRHVNDRNPLGKSNGTWKGQFPFQLVYFWVPSINFRHFPHTCLLIYSLKHVLVMSILLLTISCAIVNVLSSFFPILMAVHYKRQRPGTTCSPSSQQFKL